MKWLNLTVILFVALFSFNEVQAEYPPRKVSGERILETIKVGPISFNKIEFYKEHPLEKLSVNSTRTYVTEDKIYPQIANPENAEQKEWNEYIKSVWPMSDSTDCEGKRGDLKTDFSVEYATKDIIAIKLNEFRYCVGGPHGYPSHRYINTMLVDGVKKIKIDEIFDPNTEWKIAVFNLAIERLQTTSRGGSMEKRVSYTQDRLKKRVTENSDYHWFAGGGISSKGIEFNFGMVAGYAGGIFYAVVPWDELKPYLSKSLTWDQVN